VEQARITALYFSEMRVLVLGAFALVPVCIGLAGYWGSRADHFKTRYRGARHALRILRTWRREDREKIAQLETALAREQEIRRRTELGCAAKDVELQAALERLRRPPPVLTEELRARPGLDELDVDLNAAGQPAGPRQ
jgi:hypothetical protein